MQIKKKHPYTHDITLETITEKKTRFCAHEILLCHLLQMCLHSILLFFYSSKIETRITRRQNKRNSKEKKHIIWSIIHLINWIFARQNWKYHANRNVINTVISLNWNCSFLFICRFSWWRSFHNAHTLDTFKWLICFSTIISARVVFFFWSEIPCFIVNKWLKKVNDQNNIFQLELLNRLFSLILS